VVQAGVAARAPRAGLLVQHDQVLAARAHRRYLILAAV
jgi:hypothetical protein